MKALYLVLGSLIVSGCASLLKGPCDYTSAYQIGVNDAESGRPMNMVGRTILCEEAEKPEATKGYREGYMAIKSKAPVINIGK